MDWLPELVFMIVGVVLGVTIGRLYSMAHREDAERGSESEESTGSSTEAASESTESPKKEDAQEAPPAPTDPQARLIQFADALDHRYERLSHPKYLETDAKFCEAVAMASASELTVDDLLTLYAGDNAIIACIATETLGTRESVTYEDIAEGLLARINYPANYVRYFALRSLSRKATGPIIRDVLSKLDSDWEYEFLTSVLEAFLRRRLQEGETLQLGYAAGDHSSDELEQMVDIVDELRTELKDPLREQLKNLQKASVDESLLQSCGTILTPAKDEPTRWISHELFAAARLRVSESFKRTSEPRSVLVVGESGVGKSAAIAAAAQDLMESGYTVFRANATDLISGQSYLGQLEERIQKLVRELSGKKAVWIIESFQELAVTGRHRYSETTVLDMLFPHIETGSLRVVGEVQPAALERTLLAFPRLSGVVDVIRLAPLSHIETMALAERWIDAHPTMSKRRPAASKAELREAFDLVQQYLREKRSPGNLIEFLKVTWSRVLGRYAGAPVPDEVISHKLSTDDFIGAVAQLTGLPPEVIDDRHLFDIDKLRAHFAARVLGQSEAIDVLVERVAMIKAGTTDPSRPLGVFLFAGPTGTGKTQVAKTFTKFLFGSEERMIRLDMSEFQGPGSRSRLFGADANQRSLVNEIRRQPFSLVLLDEFEKADPEVWDFFLQVFDDGRLTDAQGNVADFRNSIIVLTSNAGASNAQAPALGFGNSQDGYRADEVHRSIEEMFRKEFVNRLDRVVVFRPLSRHTMRDILKLELDAILERRGLRRRPWVVEWDESAIEFLLTEGFSPEFGARPVRRAIECHVLTPLSIAIVRGDLPKGEQYLLVRARDGAIHGEWIDAAVDEDEVRTDATDSSTLDTRALILHARGDASELEYLRAQYEELRTILELEQVVTRKREALAEMAKPEFWKTPERFKTLSTIEHIDRVEACLRTTGDLLDRLAERKQRGEKRDSVVLEMTHRIAQRIYLLEAAYSEVVDGRPRDAFVMLEVTTSDARSFLDRLVTMYRKWADTRGMLLKTVDDAEDQGAKTKRHRVLLSVSGLAAYTILENEHGVHTLENSRDNPNETEKTAVQVYVAPQREASSTTHRQSVFEQAAEAIQSTNSNELRVVRRYQEAPTPLVRDRVRGWRTGRLDLVLAGNFDILQSTS